MRKKENSLQRPIMCVLFITETSLAWQIFEVWQHTSGSIWYTLKPASVTCASF